jgi:hypothetical protein
MVKAAFRHSNKVDFVSQMCFWDNRRHSVEIREATLQYLALNVRGPWSNKIHQPFDVPGEVKPMLLLLTSLKPYTSLVALESQLQLPGFVNTIAAYVKKLKLQSQLAGQIFNEMLYSSCLENPQSPFVSQAPSVGLTFPSFQDENTNKKHLVRCTNNWRGKCARSDFVFSQNRVVGSRKAEDAFGGKAVGKVLCLFQWKTSTRVGRHERHSLALLNIVLPLKPNTGQKISGK